MYEKVAVINYQEHKDMASKAISDVSFAKSFNACLIGLDEYFEAAKDYALLFSKDVNGNWFAQALLGIKEGENLFITKEGFWEQKRYIPAFIRRYPFIFATLENSTLALIAPYKNKELTLNEINDMVTSITKLYRQSGYFVARAYVPRAALDTNNVLTIKVIEGVYGVFKIDNSSLVSNNTLDGIFNGALQGKVISSDSLERAVLLADDLSGADIASADIGPGGEVGTSDFLVKAVPTPRFDGYLTGDNYGSKYTGLYRFTVGANANSPLGIGDKLSVVGMITDGNGLKNGSINYGAPIMSNGLNLSGGYYNTILPWRRLL